VVLLDVDVLADPRRTQPVDRPKKFPYVTSVTYICPDPVVVTGVRLDPNVAVGRPVDGPGTVTR
jgi:hypothetical protein